MYIEHIDQNDNVIINLLKETDFYNVQIAGTSFCIRTRYQNLEFIGSGSQGTVCSAYDRIYKQMVAIKKIKNPFANVEDAKRAYRELKIMKLINYKYIIKLLDAFTTSQLESSCNLTSSCTSSFNLSSSNHHQSSFNYNNSNSTTQLTNQQANFDLYLVMEYVEMNLNQVIQIKLDHERLSYLVYQLFCGLKYLNDNSIIHRDLKPSNIAIKDDCSIKILDFGLARTENKFMMTTCYIQTRNYRAPELLLGLDNYTNIVDVWSVGCIMAEMINDGQILFEGTNSLDQWEKIVDLLGTPDENFIAKLSPTISNYIKKRSNKAIDFQAIFPDSAFKILKSSSNQPTSQILTNELARDLLSKILVINPEKRITIESALQHPYLSIWQNKDDFKTKPIKLNEIIDKDYESIEDWLELINKDLIQFNFYS